MRWVMTLVVMVMGVAIGCAGSPVVPSQAVASERVETTPTATPAQPAVAMTRVILVRHGEKVDESKDAALSPAGLARADELRWTLEKAQVTAVYATDYARTRGTAAPLADALAVTVRSYSPEHPADEVRGIIARHPGETVLVVGHSPTVPAMINALVGEEQLEKLQRHDRLFVVVSDGQGAEVIALRYGAPDDGPATAAPAATPVAKPASKPNAPETAVGQCAMFDEDTCMEPDPSDCACMQRCGQNCLACATRCKTQCVACASRCKPDDWACGLSCTERLLACPAACIGPSVQCGMRCMADVSCQ
jgi:2,3-bisphosphoglycerate-dependent phosphoglycerate mutase